MCTIWDILMFCRHYEMLKLHHMNLLQELHETTMMMNMYQQQQLQQEQMRLQHPQGDQLGEMMRQRQGSLSNSDLYGNRRGSMGMSMGSHGSLGMGVGIESGGMSQRGSLGFSNSAMGNMGRLKRTSDDSDAQNGKRQKTDIDDS